MHLKSLEADDNNEHREEKDDEYSQNNCKHCKTNMCYWVQTTNGTIIVVHLSLCEQEGTFLSFQSSFSLNHRGLHILLMLLQPAGSEEYWNKYLPNICMQWYSATKCLQMSSYDSVGEWIEHCVYHCQYIDIKYYHSGAWHTYNSHHTSNSCTWECRVWVLQWLSVAEEDRMQLLLEHCIQGRDRVGDRNWTQTDGRDESPVAQYQYCQIISNNIKAGNIFTHTQAMESAWLW